MKDLEKLLRSMQFAQNLTSQFGISQTMSQMMKSQEVWNKNLTGISMAEQIARSMKHVKSFNPINASTLDLIEKSATWHKRFSVPQTTLDLISSLNQQHQLLFGRMKGIEAAIKYSPHIDIKLNNLQLAISGMSGQIAALAAKSQDWSLIEEFEEISEQAIDFTTTLAKQGEHAEDEKNKFNTVLATILSFITKNRRAGWITIRILEILVIVAEIHQYIDFIKTKNDVVTKQDFVEISRKLDSTAIYIKELDVLMRKAEQHRITNRPCEVRLKPKVKSYLIEKLPEDFEVTVLEVHHKWVHVSYFSPLDEISQTGWILKKYLDKP